MSSKVVARRQNYQQMGTSASLGQSEFGKSTSKKYGVRDSQERIGESNMQPSSNFGAVKAQKKQVKSNARLNMLI